MKRILIIVIGLMFLGTLFYYWKNPLSAKLKINGTVFFVELAITPKERERGLSRRKSLAENRGMLFLFGAPGKYHFWMRDMKFPLDFLWISGESIVDIDENIPPPKVSELRIELAPDQPVDKVLEVNAGTIKQYGIKIGDTVEYLQ